MLIGRSVDGWIRLGARLPLAADVTPTMRIDLFEGQFDSVHLLGFQTTNTDGDDGKHPTAGFGHSEKQAAAALSSSYTVSNDERAYIISLVSA